uniref:Elastin microfibril interfacer 1b n=1 Tax=Neogobius melanostomus TaxID=47308 RepID=A0A8C6V012_9GOBI
MCYFGECFKCAVVDPLAWLARCKYYWQHDVTFLFSPDRNWCAYVVTRTVSCVVEDGAEAYVKPDYHPCAWGTGQCSRVVAYRTYMRPRYKVAYKMVTEMEWKCCQGFSGENCNTPPAGAGSHTNYGQGGGRGESERVRLLEERIQTLTKNLQDLQTNMNHSGGGAGGRNPADAAQPEITETINSIQTKLDQLDNRTQAHDKTLVSINNHLVNGKGNELDGAVTGGVLTSLKEEILRELERRVSLSCSSCQAGVEDLRRQQRDDRERIRSLEKQLNALDSRLQPDGQRPDGQRPDEGCCANIQDLLNRMSDAERKISSTSEDVDSLHDRLHRELTGTQGNTNNLGGTKGSSGGAFGGGGYSGSDQQTDRFLKDFERRVNATMLSPKSLFLIDCRAGPV